MTMIEIKENNTYKVLKPELFVPETKLLGKYKLWKNTAVTPNIVCFLKDFHSYDSNGYECGNSVWFGFDPTNNTLELDCSSMGGMCGLVFAEDDAKTEKNPLDKECMNFTIKLVKNLIDNGIIEDFRNTKDKKHFLLNDCEELKELMFENPDLPLLFMAGNTGNDGDFMYMSCHSVNASKCELLDYSPNFGDGSIYTSRDQLREDVEFHLLDNKENLNLSEKELSKLVDEEMEKYEDKWSECIIVYVGNWRSDYWWIVNMLAMNN